jgi:hypothetical protein
MVAHCLCLAGVCRLKELVYCRELTDNDDQVRRQ